MQVRTGPVRALGSVQAGKTCSRATDDNPTVLDQWISNR
jgi:hypothetical protein